MAPGPCADHVLSVAGLGAIDQVLGGQYDHIIGKSEPCILAHANDSHVFKPEVQV